MLILICDSLLVSLWITFAFYLNLLLRYFVLWNVMDLQSENTAIKAVENGINMMFWNSLENAKAFG